MSPQWCRLFTELLSIVDVNSPEHTTQSNSFRNDAFGSCTCFEEQSIILRFIETYPNFGNNTKQWTWWYNYVLEHEKEWHSFLFLCYISLIGLFKLLVFIPPLCFLHYSLSFTLSRAEGGRNQTFDYYYYYIHSIPGGTWTRNLLLRREAPSPLGHRDLCCCTLWGSNPRIRRYCGLNAAP